MPSMPTLSPLSFVRTVTIYSPPSIMDNPLLGFKYNIEERARVTRRAPRSV
jgi:hypothetical protein